LSLWKPWRKTRSLSLFRRRIVSIGAGFFGFATKTLKTWKASNWMFLLLSRSRFIIIFRFASDAMYRVITPVWR
jgi:hypothetical protein